MQPALLLLVEDEETVRSVLEDSLRDGGFDLKLALNGTEALAILEREGETIHGLITDINLGSGPSGWEVAKRARELIPELPVVYMSGADAEKWAPMAFPTAPSLRNLSHRLR
jgi:CheY-like chemotaxis protein